MYLFILPSSLYNAYGWGLEPFPVCTGQGTRYMHTVSLSGCGSKKHTCTCGRVYFFLKHHKCCLHCQGLNHQSSSATCFKMLNVSKVDGEIKIIPPGWHLEAVVEMIYGCTRSLPEGIFASLKGAIKCNQADVNSKDFLWPLHPQFMTATTLKYNRPPLSTR